MDKALKAHERLMLLLAQQVRTHRWCPIDQKPQGYRRTPEEDAQLAHELKDMEASGKSRREMASVLRCHLHTVAKHLGPGRSGRRPKKETT